MSAIVGDGESRASSGDLNLGIFPERLAGESGAAWLQIDIEERTLRPL
jgi:hypothetical protein